MKNTSFSLVGFFVLCWILFKGINLLLDIMEKHQIEFAETINDSGPAGFIVLVIVVIFAAICVVLFRLAIRNLPRGSRLLPIKNVNRILCYLFDNTILLYVIAFTPAILCFTVSRVLSAPISGAVEPTTAVVYIGIAWSIMCVLAVLWFEDHRDKWVRRIRETLSAMTVNDMQIFDIIAQHDMSKPYGVSKASELRNYIDTSTRAVVLSLPRILEYRQNENTKDAALLLLQPDRDDIDFTLFHKVRDCGPNRGPRIETLAKDKSLAGFALEGEHQVVNLEDCRDYIDLKVHSRKVDGNRSVTSIGTIPHFEEGPRLRYMRGQDQRGNEASVYYVSTSSQSGVRQRRNAST